MGSSQSQEIEHEPQCKYYEPSSKSSDDLLSESQKHADVGGKHAHISTEAQRLRQRATSKGNEDQSAFNEDGDKGKVDLHKLTTTEPSFAGLLPFFLSGLLASNLVVDSVMALEDRVVYHSHFIHNYSDSIVLKVTITGYSFLIVSLLFGSIRDAKLGEGFALVGCLANFRFFTWARTAAIKMVTYYEDHDIAAATEHSIDCLTYQYAVFFGFLLVGIVQLNLKPTALHSLAYILGVVLMQYYFANIRATPDVYIIFIKAELLSITTWPSFIKWAPAVAGVTIAVSSLPSVGLNAGRFIVSGSWFWIVHRFATDAIPNMQTLISQPTNMITSAFRESREALKRDIYLFIILLIIAILSYYVDESQRVLASDEVIQWRYTQLDEKQQKRVLKVYPELGSNKNIRNVAGGPTDEDELVNESTLKKES